ncbi:TetR/AcrR family transcriptional regulator [Paraburkholderia phosphatilytica]|uniref:TetR/AcrR family transcriptional regulator n=1 Tax=Paraburkholderia phosphatilytica TaxID=2282883 RepID=UPI000E4FD646|nr:TetR/AcrR family transcriptional regulator [Paraburkholderia phosphatilytica]
MGIAERKNREKQALRERILDAARRIVVREGFGALSMRKIADAIEYSPATLYLHFESRDEIARTLCVEGYSQLLATLMPVASIADPAERLRALGRGYVAFGVAHPETYRLMFMEDPSYTESALTDAAASDESGEAAMRLMTDALDALKAQQRLPATLDSAVGAEAFWATIHGIVALKLTCPVFPRAPLETLVEAALDAWLPRVAMPAALAAQGAAEAVAAAAAGTASQKRSRSPRGAGT